MEDIGSVVLPGLAVKHFGVHSDLDVVGFRVTDLPDKNRVNTGGERGCSFMQNYLEDQQKKTSLSFTMTNTEHANVYVSNILCIPQLGFKSKINTLAAEKATVEHDAVQGGMFFNEHFTQGIKC